MTTNTQRPPFTVTARGEDIAFTSAFDTLADAYHSLDAHAQKSDFAKDLLAAARARRLSPKQAAWIHKLASDGAKPKQQSQTVEGLDLSDIIELFDRAAEAQKRAPKIVFTAPDGTPLVLKRCGERSRNPGAVNITDDGEYPDAFWFGRINRDGTVFASRGWKPEVESALSELALDPAKVASQHGIATGQCCFCNIELSDKRSRAVGYGPICAEKYGLPWGEVSVEFEAQGQVEKPTTCGIHGTPVINKRCPDCDRWQLNR